LTDRRTSPSAEAGPSGRLESLEQAGLSKQLELSEQPKESEQHEISKELAQPEQIMSNPPILQTPLNEERNLKRDRDEATPYKLPRYLPMRLFSLEYYRQMINSDEVHFVRAKKKAQLRIKD